MQSILPLRGCWRLIAHRRCGHRHNFKSYPCALCGPRPGGVPVRECVKSQLGWTCEQFANIGAGATILAK